MRTFWTAAHRDHSPGVWLFKGGLSKAEEVPERADVLLRAVREAGHELIELDAAVADIDLGAVRAVHDSGYIEFLQQAWTAWSQLPGTAAEMIPNVNLGRHIQRAPHSLVGKAGWYQADGACPIGEGTWRGALASAHVAMSASRELMSGSSRQVYALCRPPGHHAYADMAGGFCFLNNTAIAAQMCLDGGAAKVAVVDIDVHHGNGTQGIFYDRADVLTMSIHGDPAEFYPHFVGFDDETGTGAGLGCNLNVPLPQGTNDDLWISRIEGQLEHVQRFKPEVLVVALGLDASADDPLAFFNISTAGFERVGRSLGALAMPTVLIQEGGYLSPHLGSNLQAVLRGFEASREAN